MRYPYYVKPKENQVPSEVSYDRTILPLRNHDLLRQVISTSSSTTNTRLINGARRPHILL